MILFFLFGMVFLISALGGLLYLIYWPLKIHLRRSGWLTYERNKTINRIYIAFLIIMFSLSIFFRNYRSPSKKRLEEISEIKLPIKLNVIKDEYSDYFPDDFTLEYKVDILEEDESKLIQSIQNSRFYSRNLENKAHIIDPTDYITIGSKRAFWTKSSMNYIFKSQNDGIYFSVNYDTLNNQIEYIEVSP